MKEKIVPRLAVHSSQAYRLFYPQVPVIVAARSGKFVAAMPANSCMPVSSNPPMVAVSVRTGSKTNHVFKKSKRLSINWIDFAEKRLVSLLSQSNSFPDKLDSFKIPYSEILGAPVLAGAQAYAVCEKVSTLNLGDHDLFIARMVGAMASLDFDENWKFEEYHPVLYLGSSFRVPLVTLPPRRRS